MQEYKIQYKPDKDANLLECPICGQYNFKQLTQHLTNCHKMTREEFEHLYPDTPLWIPEISERCSRARAIGQETVKANIALNPDYYTESYKKRAEKRDLTHFKERTLATRKRNHSDEAISIRMKEVWQNAEYRQAQSEKAKLQHINGLTDVIANKSGRKRFNITLGGTTYKMRSTWETQLAEYLYAHNIEFQYEPFTISYQYLNEEHKYYPDFYILKSNLILEVKPFNLCKDARVVAKQNACIDKGYKFMFITENELIDLNNICFE